MLAKALRRVLSAELALRFWNKLVSFSPLSAVCSSLSAPLSWPRAENLVVVVFSRRASWASFGAFWAFTIAPTMLSISMPEPIPEIPAMTLTSPIN
ncbi:hypothetical protein D3C84_876730 [compost metagenome]